jgi:hypothetical protein
VAGVGLESGKFCAGCVAFGFGLIYAVHAR